MREPWDLAQQFIGNLQNQAAQSRSTADTALMRMIAAQVARGDAQTAQGFNMDTLAQRNVYATEADTVAFGRQQQRDQAAFQQQDQQLDKRRGFDLADRPYNEKQSRDKTILEQRLLSERENARGEYPAARRYGSAPQGGDTFSEFMGTVAQTVKNPYALAAIAATGKRESGFASSNANRSWSDPSESGQPGQAGGIMSWRAERLNNLYAFAASRGERPGAISARTQGEFMLAENPQLIQRLETARSPDEAQQMMNAAWQFAGWDKPSPEAAARLQAAREYATKFGAGDFSSGISSTPDGARRYTLEDTNANPTTEILGLPVGNSASQTAMMPSDTVKAYLDAQGLEVVRPFMATENQLAMLPPELRENIVSDPYMNAPSNKRAPSVYFEVRPRAADPNAIQQPKSPITQGPGVQIQESKRARYVNGQLTLDDGSDVQLPD